MLYAFTKDRGWINFRAVPAFFSTQGNTLFYLIQEKKNGTTCFSFSFTGSCYKRVYAAPGDYALFDRLGNLWKYIIRSRVLCRAKRHTYKTSLKVQLGLCAKK